MRIVIIIILTTIFCKGSAQTLGGNAAFNFLKLPATPLLTASGGVNVSYQANEVGLSANNPALLNEQLHSQMNLSFNGFIGGIKTYALTGVYHYEKKNTGFGGQIYFVDYGTIPQTDASGNEYGNFRPVDFVVQLSAGRQYLGKWNYGANLKFIHSNYGQYRSSALALDIGIHFNDSSRHVQAGLVAKNMGFQLKTFAGEGEDLPFDLQIGLTKRLAKAPFAFSITAQHLQRFNILYNDTTFNNDNEFSSGNNFFNKVLNHFVVASHVFLGNNIEATLGYNHLRRSELNLASSANGLSGFSMGLRLKFSKLQVMYSRASYQRGIAYNQFGLTVQLNRLMGLGKNL